MIDGGVFALVGEGKRLGNESGVRRDNSNFSFCCRRCHCRWCSFVSSCYVL